MFDLLACDSYVELLCKVGACNKSKCLYDNVPESHARSLRGCTKHNALEQT